jgi:hypothetical protein
MFTVVVRNNSDGRDTATFITLSKAKEWGASQLKSFARNVNNATIYSDDYNFKSLHASLTDGRVRWQAARS